MSKYKIVHGEATPYELLDILEKEIYKSKLAQESLRVENLRLLALLRAKDEKILELREALMAERTRILGEHDERTPWWRPDGLIRFFGG